MDTGDPKRGLSEVLARHYASQPDEEAKAPAPLRFRPPFLRTNKHDARGDAANLAVEHMLQKDFPLWAAYTLSEAFVDYADDIEAARVRFAADIYEPMDATAWCKLVLKRLDEYLTSLCASPDLIPDKPKLWLQYPLSYCSQKNRKPKMEDRHILLPAIVLEPGLNHKRHQDAFFAVFDGHHGPECAQYASAHFHRCLLDESAEDCDEAMRNAFKKFDERLTNIRSGTTAACAYLKDDVGYLGWCGDSSVGVLSPDKIVTLTRRHTPNDPVERKRIEEAGGVVVPIQGEMRVNGVLNISRALGDIQAKPMVSSEAEFRQYAFLDDDLVLFLSSDGIWDTLSEAEIYELVRTFVGTRPDTEYERLATFVADKAKEEGASDNLTLIAVFLKPVDVVWKRLVQQEQATT